MAHIALLGNPNVGKSLLFNQLTGSNQKVGNFPGITLTYLDGIYSSSNSSPKTDHRITDLPGIYGFVSTNKEDHVVHSFLLENTPDIIVNVLDATRLERNLVLTMQLAELHIPMILVLTFKDKLDKKGVKSSLEPLRENFSVPIMSINTHNTNEITKFRDALDDFLENPSYPTSPKFESKYNGLIENLEQNLELPISLDTSSVFAKFPKRWIIISNLLTIQGQSELWPPWFQEQFLVRVQAELENDSSIQHVPQSQEIPLDLMDDLYQKTSIISSTVLDQPYNNIKNVVMSKIDRVLLDQKFGIPIFIMIMFLIFQATFLLTTPISNLLEFIFNNISSWIYTILGPTFIASFLADGVIGGIGFVLVFIPQIAILFLFLAVLEESGYLSRVIFVLDQYLSKLGISGPSLAPMLLGFGCNVPGIMATKGIKDENERIAVSLVNPFMSCSARLPVYVAIAGAIFRGYAGVIITILYASGILLAIIMLSILRSTILKGNASSLLMELPDLNRPNTVSVWNYMIRHTKRFIKKATGYMALGILVLWALSIFGPSGYLGPEALSDPAMQSKTLIYAFGNMLSPLFSPMGWDVRLIVALILGFIAKEIVIGSLGVLYGATGASLTTVLAAEFTPLSAIGFLFFVLIYTPCIGTYFTLRAEIGKKWANLSVVLSLVIAYFVTLATIGIGSLFIQ